MCGIAGYIGDSPEQNILYRLRLLEYRGYDSAGIAVSDGKKIVITKRAGELKNLEAALKQAGKTAGAKLGIGHTRWATHGKPDEINAHPHVSRDGKWAVVHNGIIENHAELKSELKKLGYEFYSATDTETAAKLLEYYSAQGAAPLQALRQTCERLEGSFAMAILHAPLSGIRRKRRKKTGVSCKRRHLFFCAGERILRFARRRVRQGGRKRRRILR